MGGGWLVVGAAVVGGGCDVDVDGSDVDDVDGLLDVVVLAVVVLVVVER